MKALGPELSSRFVSAENLCIGWLETRSLQELSVYWHIGGIAHDIITELYSNKVITPGITTTDDVVWWIRQKITDLGLKTWFQPSISIQRDEKLAGQDRDHPEMIQRGDLFHCDVGIVYLGLCTDMQWQAYVFVTLVRRLRRRKSKKPYKERTSWVTSLELSSRPDVRIIRLHAPPWKKASCAVTTFDLLPSYGHSWSWRGVSRRCEAAGGAVPRAVS